MALEPTEQLEERGEIDSEIPSLDILNSSSDYTGPKTTLYRDPNSGKQYEILGKYSPNLIVDNILNYLDSSGFVSIITSGLSGSGKSTFTQMLVHKLHMKRSFQVHWYHQDDIKNFVKNINDLEVGINHIVIYDDASFALEQMKKKDMIEISKRLTYVRHIVKAGVVFIFNIHYSSAISKFLRAGSFRFLTSVTNEEVEAFENLFGRGSKWKLKDFSRYFKRMMLAKSWDIEISNWDKKSLHYTTDLPFRLGLANQVTDLGYFVYHKDGCNKCRDSIDQVGSVSNPELLIEYLVKKYGKAKVNSILTWYSFTQHGENYLDKNRISLWHTLAKIDHENHYSWHEVIETSRRLLLKKRSRSYTKHSQVESNVEEIKVLNKGEEIPNEINSNDELS